MRYLNQHDSQELDAWLMSEGGFSIDQLMELAGLSVAEAVLAEYPDEKSVLILCGPGNNGGDGLVAARHLKHFGKEPVVFCPVQKTPLMQRLVKQCQDLSISFVSDIESVPCSTEIILDAVFGFGFQADRPVRSPFDTVLSFLCSTKIPIVAVDVPSGWTVNENNSNHAYQPHMLISLTAPKLCAERFKGTHYVGGRFIPDFIKDKYGLVFNYKDARQCFKLQ